MCGGDKGWCRGGRGLCRGGVGWCRGGVGVGVYQVSMPIWLDDDVLAEDDLRSLAKVLHTVTVTACPKLVGRLDTQLGDRRAELLKGIVHGCECLWRGVHDIEVWALHA